MPKLLSEKTRLERVARARQLAAEGYSRTEMARELGMSGSNIDRYCALHGIRTRGKPGFKPGNIPKPTHVPRLVRELIDIMNREHATYLDVAKRVGCRRQTIGDWALHHEPMLTTFEAAANALGYELILRPARD